ncbi:carbohydrate ABC transporter ATP-binding protein, CUT1 family [Albimonas donghaensis]|uniref:Carbohydrate ABC transporter ATP-binding protein, CUT1 family n=1 Tax=Albimonas donghaensis TaxID=356660 RepID=A0A1H2VKH8_9RHOB|nr:sn-glycerol-3-phosphate ABC transporter ATP-binding protein UgpC [Albimonas donghaensis]SDW68861.1 carbohydrate ABC transporter ATP-binding protein, CUT1 family [Albimonas donghaensis]
MTVTLDAAANAAANAAVNAPASAPANAPVIAAAAAPAASAEPTLVIDGAVKRYPNGAVAVRGVTIEVGQGELVVFVGPSGCGKSTLLRMVAGLEDITEGEIRIAGRRVNEVEPAERDIAMVFQNYALYPHMTVRQNLAYGLKNRGTDKAEIARKVAEAAAMLQIEDFLDRKPSQLSGGQRQRVAMGRCIVRDPSLFLFDEPLSNLDARLRTQMRLEIRKLQRRLKVSAIYVTHDQVEAMTLADRIVVLNGGQVEQVGAPSEVYARPASTFVAAFIGAPAMNLIPAELAGGALRIGAEAVPFAAPPAGMAPGFVTLGLRPEKARVVPQAERAGGLPFTLDAVEELGASRLLHGRAAGADVVTAADAALPIPQGPLALHADPADLHFFDAVTGTRL